MIRAIAGPAIIDIGRAAGVSVKPSVPPSPFIEAFLARVPDPVL